MSKNKLKNLLRGRATTTILNSLAEVPNDQKSMTESIKRESEETESNQTKPHAGVGMTKCLPPMCRMRVAKSPSPMAMWM